MGTPLALKIVVILALILQFVAIVYALRLVKRTKYSAIWILCIIGFVLMTIPYFFWDYDSKKQNQVMEVLKRRAEVTEKKATEANEKVSGGYKG